jgi:hypothetical protein
LRLSGDEQQVGVSRTCDEFDAEAFGVIGRIAECMDFKFAAVAGAVVEVTNAQRASEECADARLHHLIHAQLRAYLAL